MSREIKFRAWHRLLGMSEIFGITDVPWEIEPDAIMQYTGLKDARGNEIFEGDIVEKNGESWVIKWLNGYSRFAPTKENQRWIGSWNELWAGTSVVIGNIYENPELLEVQK